MSTTIEIMSNWISVICVLFSATLARAGEYCTYMETQTQAFSSQTIVRTSYCAGYCCEDDEKRCCESDFTGLFIGCIIAGAVFVIVVIMIIVVLCKRSANMKRARIQNNQQVQNTQVAPVQPCYGHPNIFVIQPPPYSKDAQWPAPPPPPAYPGTPRRDGASGSTEGGSTGGPSGGRMGGPPGTSYNTGHESPMPPLYHKDAKPFDPPPSYSSLK